MITNSDDKELLLYVTPKETFTTLIAEVGLFDKQVATNLANRLERQHSVKLNVEIAK